MLWGMSKGVRHGQKASNQSLAFLCLYDRGGGSLAAFSE